MSSVSNLCSRQRRRCFLCLSLLFLVLGISSLQAQDSVSLVGAGSTVPLPLFNKWSQEFNKLSRTVQMQYQPLGTSEGIKLISGSKEELGKTDFSAGEILLTDQERTSGQLIELPAVIIGIVPIYNLPGNPELKFSGELLAQIFLGRIKMWNAPQIARLNPGVSLPEQAIKIVYRPGGKGSNYVFTDFLSKTSAEFRTEIGRSASPKWPLGEPAERSSDMVDKVKGLPGAIGYVELQYALTGHIPYGLVQNAAGKFIKASDETTIAACRAVEAPSWNKFSVSLTNAPGADSFPITSFSWLYLRSVSSDMKRRAALVNLLTWIYANGQQIASLQGYTELPPQLLSSIKAKVGTLK
jgi:phosphate transport system substrate-binding protein